MVELFIISFSTLKSSSIVHILWGDDYLENIRDEKIDLTNDTGEKQTIRCANCSELFLIFC